MFQLKDFTSIVASMINHARSTQNRLTDFNVGSVARTMLEAPAVEVEELYQQMWNGLKESIPVAIYNSFDFQLLAASPASGLVRVEIEARDVATLIPAQTVFRPNTAASIEFASKADQAIEPGATFVDVLVEARLPGAAGSVVAGTEFAIQPAIAVPATAVAVARFVNGSDLETEEQRKARFIAYVSTLARGTVNALRYGISTAAIRNAAGQVVERVRHQNVIEPWLEDSRMPIALVNCYVHNGVDGASAALLSEVQKVLHGYTTPDGVIVPGWKAAGVQVVVYAATSIQVSVAASVTVDGRFDAQEALLAVEAAIADYISGLQIGADVLLAEIIAAAMGVDGIVNFQPSAPTQDVAISPTQKAMTGAFTLTVV
jgi:uncharacterized phage protein gp47/JayE